MSCPTDMVGYGRTPPHSRWPDDAAIAVQFVLNYEEGAEHWRTVHPAGGAPHA